MKEKRSMVDHMKLNNGERERERERESKEEGGRERGDVLEG